MTALMKVVLVACASAVATTVLFSGFYSVVPQPAGGAYVVNKYTGAVSYCLPSFCKEVSSPPPPAPPLSFFDKGSTAAPFTMADAAVRPHPTLNYNVVAARAAGYTEVEIADYLADKANFAIAAARKDGVTDEAIINFLVNGKL